MARALINPSSKTGVMGRLFPNDAPSSLSGVRGRRRSPVVFGRLANLPRRASAPKLTSLAASLAASSGGSA